MQLMFADRAIAQRAPQHLRWQEGLLWAGWLAQKAASELGIEG